MGSSNGSINYAQSPEAQQLLNAFFPTLTGAAAGSQATQPWQALNAPMPTQQWFESISPEVKKGVWQPYQETGQNMMAGLFGSGFGGSSRGGISGTTSQLLSDYYAKAGTNYGQQLWNMTYPSMQSAWQMPYNLAASAMGTALPNTVVEQPQPSIWSSILPSLGMGAAYGAMNNLPAIVKLFGG